MGKFNSDDHYIYYCWQESPERSGVGLLVNKEGWEPKNWCFWTVVLEKTLKSPLACKEIKPVNPKGNQYWIFLGRTDAEAPILWPLDAKSPLIRKDTMLGKTEGRKERGRQRMRWLDGATSSRSLLKLISVESVMPFNYLVLCPPLLLPLIFPSIRVFPNESFLCIRWPKYWRFSFSISPSNEHPGLISFRMDWLDLLAVQGTLKSLLQHHSSKASIHQCSAFFIVQLSHPYMTTGKTTALTRQIFVGKVMSPLFKH